MAKQTAKGRSVVAIALCVAAAALFPIGAHLQTVGVYAAVADFETSLREGSTALRVVLYLALAIVASRQPRLLDGRVLSVAAIGCALTSFIALEMAIPSANVTFSAVGLACSGVATVWAGTQMALAFARLRSVRLAAVVIAGGTAMGRSIVLLIPPLDPHATVALCPAIQIAIIALLLAGNQRTLAAITRQEAPADVELTNPASFLSPVSGLFLCALLFHGAAGYGQTLGEGSLPEGPRILPVVVLFCVALWLARGSVSQKEDTLFSFAYLLVAAGYLSAPFTLLAGTDTAHTLINAGTYCFDILAWIVVVAVGQRNLLALLPTFGLLRCLMSLGTVIGAVAGHASNGFTAHNPVLAQAIAAAMLFVFIALVWTGFKNFSFSATVGSVEQLPSATKASEDGATCAPSLASGNPAMRAVAAGTTHSTASLPSTAGVTAVAPATSIASGNGTGLEEPREDRFDARCREIARRGGLTEREGEILSFLARGRNGRFLMDHYVVSRNTVKSHIKHIYSKLGVHSQQELIDLVEHDG